MIDFNDIQAASKDEKVRAWSIEKALESYYGQDTVSEAIVHRAGKIEEYIKKGGG